MYCANHTQTQAFGSCDYCGKPFCRDCLAEIQGKYYCREHAMYAFRANTMPSATINHFVSTPYDNYSDKSRLAAAILCLFFGTLGIHRFYVGKIGTGLIWFFTGGFFAIGWILDIIFIVLGFFKDKEGYPLR